MTENNTNPEVEELHQQIKDVEPQLSNQKKNNQSNSEEVGLKLFRLENFVHELQFIVHTHQEIYIPLVHLAGYSLLLLALIDYIYLFIPSYFLNPVWELQLMAKLVERVPLPLIGILLVFYGDRVRSKAEKTLLRFLSFASMGVGVLFILLLPLNVVDSFRVNTQNNIQANQQLTQQTAPLEQLKQKVNAANSKEELVRILSSENPQAPPLEISNIQKFKSTVFNNIDKAEKEAQKQNQAQLAQSSATILRNAIRYFLGCLICGVFFMYIGYLAYRIMQING